MTEPGARRRNASQTEIDGSSGLRSRLRLRGGSGGRWWDVLGLALAGGALMIAAEFLLVFSINVGAASCEVTASPDVAEFCAATGGQRHSYALVVLGLFVLAMAWGAAVGRSRPAGAALVLVGVVVLAIALLGDLPQARSEGIIGAQYEAAKASPGLGFWLELAGGALAVAAGVLRLARAS